MFVAHLVDRSFPTPGFHGSNPVISKFYSIYQLKWRDKIKKKAGMAQFKKIIYPFSTYI